MSDKRVVMAGKVIIVAIIAFLLGNLNVTRGVRNEILNRLPFTIFGLPPCPGCNIIVINLDTLRADELPCYGYARETTPNLCAFARSNILFSRFYTQSSFTLDSHMSIFTSLYPHSHHMLEALKDELNPEIPFLFQTLQNAGYRTVWVGGTSDINLPLNKGFGRGVSEIHDLVSEDDAWESKYQSILFPKLRDGKPTFIFFHSYAVHAPYFVGDGPYKFITNTRLQLPLTYKDFYTPSAGFYAYMLSRFQERLSSSVTKESIARNSTIVNSLSSALRRNDSTKASIVLEELPWYEKYDLFIGWYWKKVNKNNPDDVAYIQSLYDERIYQLDKQIKPLLDFLSDPEIKRKTIVVILSDNGEDIMEHGDFDHGWNIYNTSTHAPFILSVPRVKNGIYHELAQAVDIYPTLLDLVGVKTKAPMEGVSLVPILQGLGEQHVGERYLVGEHRGDDIVSIRNERWKMYKNNTPERQYVEFYDLMTDPTEQRNILGRHPDIAHRLDVALDRILEGGPKYASVSGEFPKWIDEAKRKDLIEKGYF